jgi:hypothetical protein
MAYRLRRRVIVRSCLAPLCSARYTQSFTFVAGVAQLAEHLICNQEVIGSIPIASSSILMVEVVFRGGRLRGWRAC